MLVTKKIKLNLKGLEGNAFSIMGAFQSQAKSEGWKWDEIDEVFTRAMSGGYQNFLDTISKYCEEET